MRLFLQTEDSPIALAPDDKVSKGGLLAVHSKFLDTIAQPATRGSGALPAKFAIWLRSSSIIFFPLASSRLRTFPATRGSAIMSNPIKANSEPDA